MIRVGEATRGRHLERRVIATRFGSFACERRP